MEKEMSDVLLRHECIRNSRQSHVNVCQTFIEYCIDTLIKIQYD